MHISKRVAIAGIATTALLTIGGGAAYAAGGNTPTPTPSATASQQPVIPGIGQLPQTPDATPAPLPEFPRVNPFRGCRFTVTDEITWIPRLHQFNIVAEPSITCLDRLGNVQVYLLQR